MEKLVKVLSQTELQQRPYTDSRSGEQKQFCSKGLKMTDGIDTFYAELVQEQAMQAPQFLQDTLYRVQLTMNVREWTTQAGQQAFSNELIIRKICKF